ncbi:IS110 family transposase, partial [Moorella naiadis]|uniref:IS110 family transposase n=1 Tax=Moorella naiadis (nom. illeg.) TaxID=3093670 RepID=UPI003D9C9996
MSKRLFAGIDVSLKENQLFCMDGDGHPVGKTQKFDNNLPGTAQMVNHLIGLMEHSKFDALSIGMEATALYWFPLFQTLRTDPRLTDLEAQILAMNPKLVQGIRKTYADVDKTDPIDASLIADRLRFGHLPEQHMPDEGLLALQRLTRFRYHLVQHASQSKNYLQSMLFLTFSEWIRTKPFSDLFGTTSSRLLKMFTSAQDMEALSLDELRAYLSEFSHNHFTDVEDKANTVSRAARDSFAIPKALAQGVHFMVKQTLQELDLLAKHLKRLDKRIAKHLAKITQPLTSIPGIGPVLAAGILAEIGDISRFPGQAQLAKFAGLTWRKHQSGGFNGDITPMTKTGNPYLRCYLIQAAQSMVQHNQEYREYYTRKVNETSRYPIKRALSLTARKLVRLVYAMLSQGQLYQTPDTKATQLASQEVCAKPLASSEPAQATEATNHGIAATNGKTKVKTRRLPHAPKNSAKPQEHTRG